MDNQERLRKAASLISELVASVYLDNESRKDRGLHPKSIPVWVRESIEWLREQWRHDPETPISSYTAQWVRGELDDNGKTTQEKK